MSDDLRLPTFSMFSLTRMRRLNVDRLSSYLCLIVPALDFISCRARSFLAAFDGKPRIVVKHREARLYTILVISSSEGFLREPAILEILPPEWSV